MAELPANVSIREVGPRDGFQNEPETIPTPEKVRLIGMYFMELRSAPVWLRAAGEALTTSIGIVAIVRVWQVYPFTATIADGMALQIDF